jgi:GNAT superfamily N-acetyltransferase
MAASVVETIETVRAACLAYDGQDPLDEAAALALKHHGTEGADVAVAKGGFALVRGGELTLAVAPQARRQGLAGRLLSGPPHAPGRTVTTRGPRRSLLAAAGVVRATCG